MPQALPTGTVTFLFTDVEGSTRLLAELGAEAYADELGRHHAIVRSAVADHGGVEVDTQGDAFFCAFGSAAAAADCAAGVQRALAATRLRVRIGLHTGEALVAGDRYVGLEVHRAARIAACGHGGQIVVSPSTAALLGSASPPLRDLGEHRLKDLSAPFRLYQLGDEDFAPLKTLFRTNLPVPANEFVGREVELRELAERATEPAVRLLTVTGSGGGGKSRIALQLAGELGDRFPDGIFWVPLAALEDGRLVASAVAQSLAVEERPDESLVAAIPRAIGEKRLLLLLDNCEHVVEAVAELASALLSACPAVLVLATSRRPLSLSGEHVYGLEPLVPLDAVALFDARSRAAGALDPLASRTDVEELCARLDNLPLAVELAAARSAAVPPAALLGRLRLRLDVLKGPRDADERQRTLQATIAWSHDLLEPVEQELFRRLAVFSEGAALDAVERVCEAELDALLALVAQSLVRQAPTAAGEPRYWMLATIHEFAAAALADAAEVLTYRERHLEWFAQLAREARGRLAGLGSTEWLDRLERDLDNLRSALGFALERANVAGEDAPGRHATAAVSLSVALAPLHVLRGRYQEAEDVIGRALALAPNPLDEVELRRRLGRVLRQRGRAEAGLESLHAAERLLDGLEARDGSWWEAWIDLKLAQANHHYYQADIDALAAVIDDMSPRVEAYGSTLQQLNFLHVVAHNAYRRERYALSEETETLIREIHRRSLELEDPGADFTLGFALLWRGRLEESAATLARGLATARSRGDALMETRCLVYGLLARRRLGDVEGARAVLRQLEALEEVHGYGGMVHANASWLAYRDGDHEAAVRSGELALAEWRSGERSGPTVFQWTARFPLLGAEVARGRPASALEHGRAMLDPSQQPLPAEVAALVSDAVERDDVAPLRSALELAASIGYA